MMLRKSFDALCQSVYLPKRQNEIQYFYSLMIALKPYFVVIKQIFHKITLQFSIFSDGFQFSLKNKITT